MQLLQTENKMDEVEEMEVEPTKPIPESIENKPYRPPKSILDIFWTLADGTDDQRTAATLKLSHLIKVSKEEEKAALVSYCRDRLVKGLSSGRKFARVGFAGALAQLLRDKKVKSKDVLSSILEKLKPQRHEKSSKSEVGGIYLGRAFGFSALIQSGKISKLSDESVGNMTEELVHLAERKSYLKAVCHTTLEQLAAQVSVDTFGGHVWPKLRDKLKGGWEAGCTLDLLSLLLKCRASFPDVVNKKFLKKHWGYPVLSEENDSNLMKATLDTEQRNNFLLERIVPLMLEDGRSVASVWSGLGEKLMAPLPEKKKDLMNQRRTLALKLAAKLVAGAGSTQEVLDIALSPLTASCLFHNITCKDDPLAGSANLLFEAVFARIKSEEDSTPSLLGLVEKLWKMDSQSPASQQMVASSNFSRLLRQMKPEESESYSNILMGMIKGTDKWAVMDDHPARRGKQTEACLRQLQYLVTSATPVNPELRTTALALMLRLAFFKVDKKVKSLQHCEACINLEEGDSTRKLCEALLFKSIDTISTQNIGHQKRIEKDSAFLELLFKLCRYIQDLLEANTVSPIQDWSDAMKDDWAKVYKIMSKVQSKPAKSDSLSPGPAFLLLLEYLGLQILVDHKTTSNLIQDVCVCYEKATTSGKGKQQDSDEPQWIEVLTEVLLNLMSLPSHLGRVITSTVYRMLTPHLTPSAVELIAEVLIPKKTRGDDAGGVLVEGEEGDGDEEDDDDDEEASSEPSDEEDVDDDNEDAEDDEEDEDEEEGESMEVDEEFRNSVRQALGQAAVDENDSDEEKEQSDMSDSEMFKMDDMLAEVFRQRKKASGGRKARQEKRAELANFRLRVLDLVENMIKSDRCGDFLLDLVRPLLLLSLWSNPNESAAVSQRARSLFLSLKSKFKGVTDTVHTREEQHKLFTELMELAHKAMDPTHMQAVAAASYIVMNVSCEKAGKNSNLPSCLEVFGQTLSDVIDKKQTKPHMSFFTAVIETNPALFRPFSKTLLSNLKDESVKVHSKTLCCSILTSLCKGGDNSSQEDAETKQWTMEAGTAVAQLLLSQQKGEVKTMLLKELLLLALIFVKPLADSKQNPFDLSVKQKLTEIKSKLNTDMRTLINRMVSAIDRANKQANGESEKKRKSADGGNDVVKKKKQK